LVANSLNNLAVVMDSNGRHQDAEPLLIRALDIRLALQLLFLRASESMGNHDSKIVDAGSVD
jgi:hypothetical protein